MLRHRMDPLDGASPTRRVGSEGLGILVAHSVAFSKSVTVFAKPSNTANNLSDQIVAFDTGD